MLAVYFGVAALLFVFIGFFANAELPLPYREGVKPANYEGPAVLEGWARFDAGWYKDIAENGYYFRGKEEQSSVAFFPLYPMVMRGLDKLGGESLVWGTLITFLSGIAIVLLMHRWCVPRLGPRGALATVVVLMLWPYAWYLVGAIYADALFIALVLLAFNLLERDRLLLATLAGAFATATRPVGIAVCIGLLARQIERRGVVSSPRLDRVVVGRIGKPAAPASLLPWLRIDRTAFRARDLVLALSLTGYAAYMVFLQAKFDNAFAFVEAEAAPGWDNTNDPHAWFKVEFFERIFDYPNGGKGYTLSIILHALVGVGALLLAWPVARRFGWGYGVFVALVMAIPLLGSKDFQGLGRYAMSAFPIFGVLGAWAEERRRWAVPALAVSAFLLFLLASAFARGSYVA